MRALFLKILFFFLCIALPICYEFCNLEGGGGLSLVWAVSKGRTSVVSAMGEGALLMTALHHHHL